MASMHSYISIYYIYICLASRVFGQICSLVPTRCIHPKIGIYVSYMLGPCSSLRTCVACKTGLPTASTLCGLGKSRNGTLTHT